MRIKIDGLQEDSGKIRELLPVGRYKCQIVLAEEREKDEKLQLRITMQVAEGDFEGRKLFDTLSYPRSDMSEEGKKFCRARIKNLTNASGIVVTEDGFETSDLMGRFIVAQVGVQKGQDGVERNNIQEYFVP